MSKKRLVVAFAFAVLCFMFTSGFSVYAEEKQEKTNQTEAAKTFEDDILPYILDFLTVAAGVVIAVTPILSKLIKAKKTFELARDNIDNVNKENKASRGDVKRIEERFEALYEEQNVSVLEMKQDLKAVMGMCKIAFLNDKNLVETGHAGEIAKVANHEETEATHETAD